MYLCFIMDIEDGPRDYYDKNSVTWGYNNKE